MFPTEKIELSDAWVVVAILHLTREQRDTYYSDVFTLRGSLRDTYVHKGQAAKMYDTEVKLYKYCLVEGVHIMHGTEGELEDLPSMPRQVGKDFYLSLPSNKKHHTSHTPPRHHSLLLVTLSPP